LILIWERSGARALLRLAPPLKFWRDESGSRSYSRLRQSFSDGARSKADGRIEMSKLALSALSTVALAEVEVEVQITRVFLHPFFIVSLFFYQKMAVKGGI
jgi:hypothetical protein